MPHVPTISFWINSSWELHSPRWALWSFSSCNYLHRPVASVLVWLTIVLCALFSKAFSQWSSLNARDQALHPYKSTGKEYNFVYFEMPSASTKHSVPYGSKHLPNLMCSHAAVLVWQCSSQICEVDSIYRGLMSCLCVVVLCCILLTEHELTDKCFSMYTGSIFFTSE